MCKTGLHQIATCRKFTKTIFEARDTLFLFVTNPDIDGTNNRAEKISSTKMSCTGKYQEEQGPRGGTKRYAMLGSVLQTLNMNGLNFVGKGLEIIHASLALTRNGKSKYLQYVPS